MNRLVTLLLGAFFCGGAFCTAAESAAQSQPAYAADFAAGDGPLFRAGQGTGGSTRRGSLPGTSTAVTILRESMESLDGSSSRASTFFTEPLAQENTLLVQVNAVLARSKGEAPVFFVVEVTLARISPSDKLIGAGIGAECGGPNVPGRFLFSTGDAFSERIKALPAGSETALSGADIPGLCFGVWPTGGEKKLKSLRFTVSLRVENGAPPEEVALTALTVRELSVPPAAGDVGVQVVGEPWCAPGRFWQAAAATGLKLLPCKEALDETAGIYVLAGGWLERAAPMQVEAALLRGAGVLAAFTGREGNSQANGTQAYLPLNPWSAMFRNKRYDSGIVAAQADGAFADLPALAVNWRYDLHLPYAPLETGEHRYAEYEYGKNLLNGDWRIEQVCDLDGRLPALVSGRYGPGRTAVFCADLFDARLLQSPGYAGWIKMVFALLQAPQKIRPVPAQSVPNALTVRVPMFQPGAERYVEIVNKGPALEAAFSYKVRNQAGELTNAKIAPLALPANATTRAPVELTCSALSGETATFNEDLPYWSIEAGVLAVDRTRVIAQAQGKLCTAQPLAIGIVEDTATYDTMKNWASAGDFPDGRLAYRYVYNTGETPQIEIVLSNGRVNLAPLAQARDEKWPENPTTTGLNDLSFSLSSVRERLPKQGGWAGKQGKEQALSLAWPEEVRLCGLTLTGYGAYRKWQRINPRQFLLSAGAAQNGDKSAPPLIQETQAEFACAWGVKPDGSESLRAYYSKDFPAAAARECRLVISGLDPAFSGENPHHRPSNCSLLEWQVYGWPAASLPSEARGKFRALWRDLFAGTETVLMEEEVVLPALQAVTRSLKIPASDQFSAGRLEVSLVCGSQRAVHEFPVLFVPADAPALLDKRSYYSNGTGLLCSPGMVQADNFGMGMGKYIQGWGGPHDQLWMLLHNQMEWSAGTRNDPARMLAVPGRICHYTNPFKEMPDGVYGWDYAAGKLLEKCVSGEWRNRFAAGQPKRFHVIGSDRWNGVPVGVSFGWGEFIAFDEYLHEKTGQRLQARGRAQIGREIAEKYADHWQRWTLGRYAEKMLQTQAMFAEAGIEFTFETHGSFPVCGGELGAKLARTHTGVGTDLFWELRKQDLIWSIGSRFGVVAANPDLLSGAYQQWGWVNSDLNRYWFANNGSPAPATRQWYATYFSGRVDLGGRFAPYHMMGYSSQGDVGTKMLPEDYRAFYRVRHLITRVRPERAAGFGMVASWPEQERGMGPRAGNLAFGLFPSAGRESVDLRFGQAYHKLVKSGLPVSFVTSTDALRQWNATLPLVLVGGYGYNAQELRELARLNASGAPLLAIGGASYAAPEEDARKQAAELFGVATKDGQPTVRAGTVRIVLADDVVLYIRPGQGGRGWTAYCPQEGADLSGAQARRIVQEALALCGNPLRMSAGLCATTMIAQDGLWLALADQGDEDRTVEVRVKPEWFLPATADKTLVAVDLDGAQRIELKKEDGALVLRVPMAGTGGRLVLLRPTE